jgi:hypothetical protein
VLKRVLWALLCSPLFRLLAIADLTTATAELERLVHVRVFLPITSGRDDTLDTHAAAHVHFQTVRLRLGAIGDGNANTGVPVAQVDTRDQIKHNEDALHQVLPGDV